MLRRSLGAEGNPPRAPAPPWTEEPAPERGRHVLDGAWWQPPRPPRHHRWDGRKLPGSSSPHRGLPSIRSVLNRTMTKICQINAQRVEHHDGRTETASPGSLCLFGSYSPGEQPPSGGIFCLFFDLPSEPPRGGLGASLKKSEKQKKSRTLHQLQAEARLPSSVIGQLLCYFWSLPKSFQLHLGKRAGKGCE